MRRAVLLGVLLMASVAVAAGVQRTGDPTVAPPPGVEVVVIKSESVHVVKAERG